MAWIMEEAKRARKAETPKRPSRHLRSSAPYFYPDPQGRTPKRRKREISRARAVLCYLAVDEMDYSGEELARILEISGRGVSDCRDRGKIIIDNPEIIREYLS